MAIGPVVLSAQGGIARTSSTRLISNDGPTAPASATVDVTAPTLSKGVPSTFVAPVTVNDITVLGITSFQFHVLYDPTVIDPSGANFGCSTVGTITASAGLGVVCNVQPIDATHSRLLVAVFGSGTLSGSGTILNVTFSTFGAAVAGNASPLAFEPGTVFFFDAVGIVPDVAVDGLVTLVAPTAAPASVSGSVVSSSGRPVSNVQITLTDGAGLAHRAISNPFGFYSFADIPTGSVYVMNAYSKRYVFQPRVVMVLDDLAGVDLVAEP